MIRAKQFEKALRHDARKELRTDKKLWKEYRARRTSWRDSRSAKDLAILYWLYLPGLIIAYADHPKNVLLLLLTIYSTGTVIVRSADLQARLHISLERFVTVHYPLADRAFACWQIHGFLWRSIRLLGLVLFVFGAIAYNHNVPWWTVPIFALGQWLLALAGIAFVSQFWPRLNRLWGYGIYLLMLAIPTVVSFQEIPFIWAAVSPLGWLPALYGTLFITKESWTLPLIFPAIVGALATPWLYRRTIDAYTSDMTEVLSVNVAESEALEETDADLDADQRKVREDFIAARNESALTAVSFSPPRLHARGWIENLAFTHLLHGREHVVAEFMFAAEPDGWSKKWRLGVLLTMAACVATFLLRAPWPAWLGLVAVVFLVTPLAGGYWPGFSVVLDTTLQRPIHATYPVTSKEISWLMVKVHWLRIVFGMPALVALAVAIGWAYGLSAGYVFSVSGICVWWLMALQPAYAGMWLSSRTNDSQSYNWQKQTMMLLGLALVFVLIGLLASTFIFPSAAVLLALPVPLVTTFWWWLYVKFYDRGRVDLLKISTQ